MGHILPELHHRLVIQIHDIVQLCRIDLFDHLEPTVPHLLLDGAPLFGHFIGLIGPLRDTFEGFAIIDILGQEAGGFDLHLQHAVDRIAPHGKVRELIHLANSSMAPIVSFDLPSGLDTTSGELYTPHIRAAATMALGLPKVGLPLAAKQGALGDLYLADVGIPPQLYAQLGLVVPPLFADGSLVGLTVRGDEVWVSSA